MVSKESLGGIFDLIRICFMHSSRLEDVVYKVKAASLADFKSVKDIKLISYISFVLNLITERESRALI